MPSILSVGRLLGGSILGGFSPVSLFAASEPGGWYDPSDLTTMFQDAAGTTPVTAVEQPVGLVLDKSKGLVLGAELVTNGTFDSDTWWSKTAGTTISGGTANLVNEAVGNGIYRNGVLTAGKYYEFRFTIVSISSGSIKCMNSMSSSATFNSVGTYSVRLLGDGGLNYIQFVAGSANTTASIDNVSVKEVSGSHLSQSTSTARPVLSARVNLLTQTEAFDNAAWTKNNATVTANQGTDPLGGNTADKFAAASDANVVQLLNPAVSGLTYTFSVWIKGVSSSGTTEIHWSNAAVTPANTTTVNFTTSWQRFTVTGSIPSTVGYAQIGTWGSRNSGPSADILIWGADLRPSNAGVGLPSYQRVTTSTDYDTTGFPLYLKFDGTDDFLVSGTINPGSVDKAQVFAGVRKLSDAATAVIAEWSDSYSTVGRDGTFILSSSASGASVYGSAFKGTNIVGGDVSGYAAPITNVLSNLFDIPGDVRTFRSNGTQASLVTGDAGAGNFSSQVLYVGRRGGTSLPFNGHLHQLLVRFSATNLDAATITATETWVNQRTKAF